MVLAKIEEDDVMLHCYTNLIESFNVAAQTGKVFGRVCGDPSPYILRLLKMAT